MVWWLILIVPVAGVAALIWLRHAAARRVGLPSMTPCKLSAAVSKANKLGQDSLSVTLAQAEANRATGPMAAIGWQVNTATLNRTSPTRSAAVVFARVPARPTGRYEYLYDRDTWVRRPSSHLEYLGDGSTPAQP
jgi:hypothetical protein